MLRVMQPSDLEPLKALWTEVFGDDAAFAEMALCRFAGEKNVLVAEEDGRPVAMLSAVPVRIGERGGAYLYALATQKDYRGRGLMTTLIEAAARARQAAGDSFLALLPAEKSLFDYYGAHGFQKAFGLRRVQRQIKRNIWAQAEFDSLPAKKLCDTRLEYCPEIVQLSANEMIPVLTDLYSRGITVVSSDEGYGLYFRHGETLQFIELQADGDRAAERLMEAAREKEVVVENAEITIGAAQNLFLGEGVREDYGMIRFLGEPFDVSESYMRLMLDV